MSNIKLTFFHKFKFNQFVLEQFLYQWINQKLGVKK